jgi:hypothetical protein
MFAIAASHRLSISRFQVWRLNDENVLKPPHTPTEINCCNAAAVSVAPRRSISPDTNPSKADATIFTTSVPKGKVSPNRSATQPDHQNRQILPSAPPINTKIVASIFCRIPSSCEANAQKSQLLGEDRTQPALRSK